MVVFKPRIATGLGGESGSAEVQKSPFLHMMVESDQRLVSWKNGDETCTEAAGVAAPAIVAGVCSAVSHTPGVEASAAGGPQTTGDATLGSAAAGARPAG